MQISPTGQYQYQTVIAHPVAAAQGQPVFSVAQAIAQHLTAHQEEISEPMAMDLRMTVLPSGSIELTLSPMAVAGWWQQCRQGAWPKMTAAMSINDHCLTEASKWPLGDRLQVSLSTLLQWAHSRCRRWSINEWPTIDASPLATAQRRDPLTIALQPILIRCWDDLAAQPMQLQRWQRSGYELAETIYALEAQRSHWSIHMASCPEAAMTLVITQAFLALLLQVLTGALPAADL